MILTAADSMDDQWSQGKPFNTRACSYKTNDARFDCWAALLTINTRVSGFSYGFSTLLHFGRRIFNVLQLYMRESIAIATLSSLVVRD